MTETRQNVFFCVKSHKRTCRRECEVQLDHNFCELLDLAQTYTKHTVRCSSHAHWLSWVNPCDYAHSRWVSFSLRSQWSLQLHLVVVVPPAHLRFGENSKKSSQCIISGWVSRENVLFFWSLARRLSLEVLFWLERLSLLWVENVAVSGESAFWQFRWWGGWGRSKWAPWGGIAEIQKLGMGEGESVGEREGEGGRDGEREMEWGEERGRKQGERERKRDGGEWEGG